MVVDEKTIKNKIKNWKTSYTRIKYPWNTLISESLFEFYQSPENPVAPNVELGLAVSTIMLAFGVEISHATSTAPSGNEIDNHR